MSRFGADRATRLVEGWVLVCHDPQLRARVGDLGSTRAVNAVADRVAEILERVDMSQLQFIESARRAESRPTLDLQDQLAYLRDEWRLMLRPGTMAADALAGLAVALVALPLSLAIATASGVEPEIGLVTAIVGGIVVALFGGSRLQVSGPAAAMTFLVYEIVSRYGMQGMVAATLMAAHLQLLAGVLRLGRFI